MPKVTNQWWRALFFGLLFVVGYKIIDNFSKILDHVLMIFDILTPFIIGGVIAFFLHKPVDKLRFLIEKARIPLLKKYSMPLAIGGVYLLFLLVCAFVISFLIEAIYDNIAEIITNWDIISARAMEIFNGVNIPQKQEWLDKANAFLTNLLETEVLLKAGNIVGGVASSLVSIFTGLIISVYTIAEKESLKALVRSGLYLVFRSSRVLKINSYIRRLIDMFYSYFTGLAIDAVVIGAVSIVFYMLYDAPYPWLLGLVAAVGNMIPFFGPIIAAIIITLMCLIALGPLDALWVLLFQLVLGQIDGNLIQPRIVGNSVGISPFWVIFAVLFFGGIWGAAGMLLGVPIVAAVRMVLMTPVEIAEAPESTPPAVEDTPSNENQ